MNKKIVVPIIILTILLPFIATPTRQAHANGPIPNYPGDLGAFLQSAGFSLCIFPALTEVWYQLIHVWLDDHAGGPEGTFEEWGDSLCNHAHEGDGGFAASAVGGSAGGTVIPGTWGTPIDLAVNTPPPIALPEFNPSIAADPTDPNNVVEGQFAINAAGGLASPPFALQCSLAVSHDAGVSYTTAIPSALPLVGLGFTGGPSLLSFCSRAMVAWDSAGNVYVLYTDYELTGVASTTHSLFRMVKSTDKGVTWTDLSGNPGATTIHDVPLVVGGGGSGTEAGIPIFPVLAVSGSNLDVAYTLFSNQPTNDIRSISTANANTPFTNPVVIATVNPSTGHFILAPSNAYNGGTLYVVWYDDDTVPPPSILYEVRGSKSTDNGVTWTAPTQVFLGSESVGPFHRGVLTWPSEWPHLAVEPNSNFAYVVTSQGLPVGAPVTNIWNQYEVAVIYSTTGDITGATIAPIPNFPNPALIAPFDQLFPAVTTQPDGTVHVTWADTTFDGPVLSIPPHFQIFYSASNPANLQPAVAVENWAIPQVASFAAGRAMSFFEGIFFSVTASSSTATVNGYVHPAWAQTDITTGGILGMDTFTNRGEKPLLPVGGAVLPTNQLALLAPYLLVAVFATLGLAYAMRRRFRGISLPTIPTGNW
jgi:hypothetical protein